jgi:hypothetical protein
MGVGLFVLQQGRPPDHAELPGRDTAAGMKRFSDLTIGL